MHNINRPAKDAAMSQQSDANEASIQQPSALGYQLQPGERWLQHHVQRHDTIAHLALKYDTSVGKICRANHLHWQDMLQAHEYIWLPVLQPQDAAEAAEAAGKPATVAAAQTTERAAALERRSSSIFSPAMLPPHIIRESVPNMDDFAEDGDPLLFITKFMWNDGEL